MAARVMALHALIISQVAEQEWSAPNCNSYVYAKIRKLGDIKISHLPREFWSGSKWNSGATGGDIHTEQCRAYELQNRLTLSKSIGSLEFRQMGVRCTGCNDDSFLGKCRQNIQIVGFRSCLLPNMVDVMGYRRGSGLHLEFTRM